MRFLFGYIRLIIHTDHIPALISLKPAIECIRSKRYGNQAREDQDQKSLPLEMHKEIIRKKSDEVYREYSHKKKFQKGSFKNLRRIVRRSDNSLKHGTGKLSDIPEEERQGMDCDHESDKNQSPKEGEKEHFHNKKHRDIRNQKQEQECIDKVADR